MGQTFSKNIQNAFQRPSNNPEYQNYNGRNSEINVIKMARNSLAKLKNHNQN